MLSNRRNNKRVNSPAMREAHPVFHQPTDPGTVIWRYFSFPKFVDLLTRRALFFSSADLLGDHLEGSFTRAKEASRHELLENPPDDISIEQLQETFRHNASISRMMPRMVFVNSWHIGQHESMAMWSGYGEGSYGVAVSTTCGVLDEVLPDSQSELVGTKIFIGTVQYLDYLSTSEKVPEEFNAFGPFVCKSLVFSHEAELRALFFDPRFPSIGEPEDRPKGYHIDVDLARLIQRVVVSPLAPSWFMGVVSTLCRDGGISVNIEPSSNTAKAIF